MNKIFLYTDFPIAYESKDHIVPHGTANDNLHSINFVNIIKEKLGSDIKYLDLGCAGGGLIFDFLSNNILAAGIDGSDYSKKNKRANWGNSTAEYLFTADITKPFYFKEYINKTEFKDEDRVLFSLITSFDVLEHMHNVKELQNVIKNIHDNLKPGGYTLHSIANFPDEGYHHILEDEVWWINIFERNGFIREEICEKHNYARSSTYNLCFKKL